MHEHDLPAALAADLDGSFERLVVTFQDRLYAFALRFIGSPQDAEEILVDALWRAYQALGAYPAERIQSLALRPWLYQITLNVCRNRLRGRRLATVSLDQADERAAVAYRDHTTLPPDNALERAELRRQLSRHVATLPERERLAVVLRHVQGLGYGEMAQILGQPVGTVKANVHRGIRRLRAALQAYDAWR